MRPFCLLDYFPKDFLTIIDESHVTVPQLRAMYGGDLSRKLNLVEYGFRLEAALDNRPLKFPEFERLTGQTIYVSATPADYELQRSGGIVTEQVIRPTGLLDPEIVVRPSMYQIDDLLEEIQKRVEANERTLVTTLTKRMAEELNEHLIKYGVSSAYIHSGVDTLERIRILQGLRDGEYDVIVGVNLLREGLDLPEVSLVAILDADKEGFLRNHRSLTQTAGRAARNVNGTVIMYADRITDSMKRTIEETERRRAKQIAYNEEHGITPTPIVKQSTAKDLIELHGGEDVGTHHGASANDRKTPKQLTKLAPKQTPQKKVAPRPYIPVYEEQPAMAADPIVDYMDANDLRARMEKVERDMREAARRTDFLEAAALRDEMLSLRERLSQIEK